MWGSSASCLLVYPVSCHSSRVPCCTIHPLHATQPGLALPCLVLAGCLAEDSGAPGSRTELCWKPVHSDGQQQIQLHLSLAVKPAVWTRGREARGDRRGGVCAREYVCVCMCVWQVGGYSGGALIGMSELHGVCVCVRVCACVCVRACLCVWRRESGGGLQVSSSWASEQVLLYVSQAHESPTRETQYKFGFISTPRIDLFWFFLWGFWFQETIDGSQVKMSVLSSLTSCLHFGFFFFFPHTGARLDDCFLSRFPPFMSQVAECRRLEQCQIHLRMWKPSPGPPHPPCLLHPRLSAKQPIATLHIPLLPVKQVRTHSTFDYSLRWMTPQLSTVNVCRTWRGLAAVRCVFSLTWRRMKRQVWYKNIDLVGVVKRSPITGAAHTCHFTVRIGEDGQSTQNASQHHWCLSKHM